MECVATYTDNSQAIDDPFGVYLEADTEERGEIEFLPAVSWRSMLEKQVWLTHSCETLTKGATGQYGIWMSGLSTGGVRWIGLPASKEIAQARKNEAALRLVRSWLADESGYDEKAWPVAKPAIETHRLSDRKRFSD